MQIWMFYTPIFQLMTVLISSPLALLVTLWGMTSKSLFQRSQHPEGGQVLSLVPETSAS
jgi:hypothetical protein